MDSTSDNILNDKLYAYKLSFSVVFRVFINTRRNMSKFELQTHNSACWIRFEFKHRIRYVIQFVKYHKNAHLCRTVCKHHKNAHVCQHLTFNNTT
jgi:hypothetical protein